jgi:TonB C terminal
MRTIVTFLLALTCYAATAPALADPQSDYHDARLKYIQKVAFLFRQNINFNTAQIDNPEVTIQLNFAASGKFLAAQIEEGSGDPSFDMSVQYSLQKTIPELPPAPIPPGTTKPFSYSVRVCSTC